MRVALFTTCLDNTVSPRTGKAITEVLHRLGHQVSRPDLACCGQTPLDTGRDRDSHAMTSRFATSFADADAVVTQSAAAAARVADYYTYAAATNRDQKLAHTVADIITNLFDFTELLVERLHVTDVGAHFPYEVAYHPTCSIPPATRETRRCTRLLRAVRGLRLSQPSELRYRHRHDTIAEADIHAGTHALYARRVSLWRPQILTAADSACLAHLGDVTTLTGHPIKTVHLAEILADTGTRDRGDQVREPSNEPPGNSSLGSVGSIDSPGAGA
ncbi:Fe-S oxidoreductase [Longispora fulva]|uniref:L-lactate dehydrogenase complex protein LldE n=1 Tax=Longispora fulva TaxID=619741 RepID=A0A8J7KVW6_9ACTN|nr:(Fe-S)-binding protein [Longispora fulva]MBG6135812.1 L-lactate dehydrogenase complex protein LldE [Longispora fulva]GIG55945.1 Fe-S oxidoreductase [Longispora fulva]